jgi:hypothetical protein
MLRPPDFLWVCTKCGNQIEGYDDLPFEINSSPPPICPDPKCEGFMEKTMEKKDGPFPENPFKKY